MQSEQRPVLSVDFPVGDLRSRSIDRELLSVSFEDLRQIITWNTRVILERDQTIPERADTTIALLELFVVLCNKWMYSRNIDKSGKELIKASREVARVFLIVVTKRRNGTMIYPWDKGRMHKLTDKMLAEEWKARRIIDHVGEVYNEPTREQKMALEVDRAQWEREGRTSQRLTSFPWEQGRLLGMQPGT